MAISNLIVWEVRTTGSATNGAGFKSGASGTDWSKQDAAQYSVADGVTAGTTTITSATANFGTDVVGNLIYVSGGTGSVAADWYEIISRTNSTTIVVDRSTGLTAGTGVTLHIGGGADHVTTINAKVVAGNVVYVKNGTYNLSATFTPTTGTVASGITKPTVWVGYNTTRTILNTDASQPVIASNGNALNPIIALGNYIEWRNIKIDGSGATKAARGITCSGSEVALIERCTVSVFTDCGILLNSGSGQVINCYATGGTSAASNGAFCSNVTSRNTLFLNCVADANANAGFVNSGYTPMIGCLSINNTTSNGQGFVLSSGGFSAPMLNCVAYNNASDGIRITGGGTECGVIRNCVLISNTGYGINSATGDNRSTSGTPAGTPFIDYNAFYNNNSGGAQRNQLDAGSHDVTLTGVPFTNAASGDFSLNNTASQGAACRAAGFPGALLSGGTGYLDLGAIQHQDAGGGGGGGNLLGNGTLVAA